MDKEKTVTHYLNYKVLKLSETVKFYLVYHVPKCKLTREKDIEKFAERVFNVDNISFERPFNIDYKYWSKFSENIPLYRIVSSLGYIDGYNYPKLLDEGIEFEQKDSKIC